MEGRLIILERPAVSRYMAISETVQEAVAQGYPPTVFISPGWERKGLSLGKNQRIGYIKLDACHRDGLEVVRRHTDGYAIIHYTDDVTYGIAVPKAFVKSARDLDDRIFPVLVKSLERVGVENCHDPFPKKYGNVYAGDKKIVGSSQNRRKTAWLQHGIVAVKGQDSRDYARYTALQKEPEKIDMETTSIEKEGKTADPAQVASIMADEFRIQLPDWGIHLEMSSLSSEEQQFVEKLLAEKYQNSSWLQVGEGRYDKSGRIACFIE